MNTSELKNTLNSPYQRTQWLKFLHFAAGQKQHRLQDTLYAQNLSGQFAGRESYPITELWQIGNYHTEDKEIIPIYEITLKDEILIERNRVGVNDFVKNVVLRQQGSRSALCVFTYAGNEISEWRFSFVSKFSASQYFTEIESLETNPKKYTYIFGTPEPHKTAIERFQALRSSPFHIEDFFEAFSVEKVSKAFFDGYKEIYEDFVEYMTGKRMEKKGNKWVEKVVKEPNNQNITMFKSNDKEARDFFKRLMGRIVFIYFLQKKQWLGSTDTSYQDGDIDFLKTLYEENDCQEEGTDYYLHILQNLFFETLNTQRDGDAYLTPKKRKVCVPFLNGGLFDDSSEPKGYELMIIHNYLFKNFFDFLSEYNFTIDESSPEEQTVAVDPEMLGQIFENLLEDNKDKGAFYTPKEIVHYMCQESLIQYLSDEESPAIRQLVKNKENENLSNEQLLEINQKLDEVKICDPAIGSGAFPMGLLQEIFALKELIAYRTETEWNPPEVKSNIIQNSIYGVDIEQGAVDIAQLRFWLSLVVDENMPRPLPNLDYKIVVGNSLVTQFNGEIIELDWDSNTTKDGMFNQRIIEEKIELLKKLAEKQYEYFTADKKSKKKLSKEVRQYTLQVLEKQLEQTIESKGYQPDGSGKIPKKYAELSVQTQIWKKTLADIRSLQTNQNEFDFFDWQISFPEILNPYIHTDSTTRGFHIVIGNPPYLRLQRALPDGSGQKYADLYKDENYQTFDRNGDIYCLFYERGMQLTQPLGQLCYITSNKWMRAQYGESLRKYFTHYNPELLIDLGPNVFEATVDTNILLIQNAKTKTYELLALKPENKEALAHLDSEDFVTMDSLSSESWVILNPIERSIKEKIERIGTPLKDWDVQINYGIKTGYNEAFIINGEVKDRLIAEDPKSAEVIRPLLRGRDIKRYGYDFAERWLIATFPSKNYNIGDYPAIENFLLGFKPKLMQTGILLSEQEKREIILHAKNYGIEISFKPQEKSRKKTVNKWFETQDSIAYWDEFSKQKIMYPDICQKTSFCKVDIEAFGNNTVYFITSENNDLDYLLSYLNSDLIDWYYKTISVQLGEKAMRMFSIYVLNIPIPKNQKTDILDSYSLNNNEKAFIENLYRDL